MRTDAFAAAYVPVDENIIIIIIIIIIFFIKNWQNAVENNASNHK